ncbi:MAG TPA: hypothetical protein VGK73_25970 [Polyangiaceae bacterium]
MIHPFEKAGLGKAPFRCVGVTRKVGPIRIANRDGTTTEIGAEGQPMGRCDFCGTGIADCYEIRSADRREFVVGCDCVAKVCAKGEKVFSEVERMAMDLKNAAARKRHDAKAAASQAQLAELLAAPQLRGKLSSKPSAYAWKAAEGATALDDAEWLARQCGHAGRLRLIKRLQSELATP